jgi:hypothetical protein
MLARKHAQAPHLTPPPPPPPHPPLLMRSPRWSQVKKRMKLVEAGAFVRPFAPPPPLMPASFIFKVGIPHVNGAARVEAGKRVGGVPCVSNLAYQSLSCCDAPQDGFKKVPVREGTPTPLSVRRSRVWVWRRRGDRNCPCCCLMHPPARARWFTLSMHPQPSHTHTPLTFLRPPFAHDDDLPPHTPFPRAGRHHLWHRRRTSTAPRVQQQCCTSPSNQLRTQQHRPHHHHRCSTSATGRDCTGSI